MEIDTVEYGVDVMTDLFKSWRWLTGDDDDDRYERMDEGVADDHQDDQTGRIPSVPGGLKLDMLSDIVPSPAVGHGEKLECPDIRLTNKRIHDVTVNKLRCIAGENSSPGCLDVTKRRIVGVKGVIKDQGKRSWSMRSGEFISWSQGCHQSTRIIRGKFRIDLNSNYNQTFLQTRAEISETSTNPFNIHFDYRLPADMVPRPDQNMVNVLEQVRSGQVDSQNFQEMKYMDKPRVRQGITSIEHILIRDKGYVNNHKISAPDPEGGAGEEGNDQHEEALGQDEQGGHEGAGLGSVEKDDKNFSNLDYLAHQVFVRLEEQRQDMELDNSQVLEQVRSGQVDKHMANELLVWRESVEYGKEQEQKDIPQDINLLLQGAGHAAEQDAGPGDGQPEHQDTDKGAAEQPKSGKKSLIQKLTFVIAGKDGQAEVQLGVLHEEGVGELADEGQQEDEGCQGVHEEQPGLDTADGRVHRDEGVCGDVRGEGVHGCGGAGGEHKQLRGDACESVVGPGAKKKVYRKEKKLHVCSWQRSIAGFMVGGGQADRKRKWDSMELVTSTTKRLKPCYVQLDQDET